MAGPKLLEPGGLRDLWENDEKCAAEVKRGVRANFARRAASYDRHAAVQQGMAETLVQRTAAAIAGASRILEIGCGTGYLTWLLRRRNPGAFLMAVDLDRALLQAARARLGQDAGVVWVMADGETLGRGNFDLIIANACFQWFAHPWESLARLGQALAPGGTLAFATLGPGTFRELAASLEMASAQLGCGPRTIPASQFLDRDAWLALLSRAGYRDAEAAVESKTVSYAGVPQFLHSLKATGATNPRPRPFSPRLLAALAATYQREYGVNGIIPATYEIIWVTASR